MKQDPDLIAILLGLPFITRFLDFGDIDKQKEKMGEKGKTSDKTVL